MRAALASRADLAILPPQDRLELTGSARTNVPGTPLGNWEWRLPAAGWLEPLHAVSNRAGPAQRTS